MAKAIIEYVPKAKREAVKDAYRDEDGYWICLKEGWEASNTDSGCRTIHEDTIADLRYQISGIRRMRGERTMAKSNIIKVEALTGCTAGLEITRDFTKAVKYMVTYETGSVRYYDAEKAPKTVMAWIEANVEVIEPELEVVEEEITPFEQEVIQIEQVVEQVVEQAVPQRTRSYQTVPTLSDIDIEWMSWMWDITNLLLMLFRFGLIGAAWLLEGAARALPVIRAVIMETAGVIQEIAGWIFEGADLVKEAVVYVGALL